MDDDGLMSALAADELLPVVSWLEPPVVGGEAQEGQTGDPREGRQEQPDLRQTPAQQAMTLCPASMWCEWPREQQEGANTIPEESHHKWPTKPP